MTAREAERVTCDWQGCPKNREHGFLFCAEHLKAEYERWFAQLGTEGDPEAGFDRWLGEVR